MAVVVRAGSRGQMTKREERSGGAQTAKRGHGGQLSLSVTGSDWMGKRSRASQKHPRHRIVFASQPAAKSKLDFEANTKELEKFIERERLSSLANHWNLHLCPE